MSLVDKPGFYPDITCEQYFAEPCPAPALTNSGIKTLLNACPARFAHDHPAIGQTEEERKATAAMRMGSVVHRLALDKGDDYEAGEYDDYRSKAAKEWRDEVEASGKIPLKPSEFEKASAMAEIIRGAIEAETRGHPYATEVVIAWRDPLGFWCRGMLDVWCPDMNLALDVKTCADAGDKSVNRAFATGYAHQDEWYSSGIASALGKPTPPSFGFLFVEKDAPYLARYAGASEGFRQGARIAIDRGREIFATCLKSGKWPGYQPFIAQPPSWWLSEITDIELMEAAQ